MNSASVAARDQIQWETFNQDNTDHSVVGIADLSVSDKMIEVMLGFETYTPHRYIEAGIWKTGYGIANKNHDKARPITEASAYSSWIANVKRLERVFKQQLAQDVPASVYDGLFSYFYSTRKWVEIQGPRTTRYDVLSAVRSRNWTLVSDMIANSAQHPTRSRVEARVMQLNDYPAAPARNKLKSQGLQQLRSDFVIGFEDKIAEKQALLSYFVETSQFLPGLDHQKKMAVSRLARPFMT